MIYIYDIIDMALQFPVFLGRDDASFPPGTLHSRYTVFRAAETWEASRAVQGRSRVRAFRFIFPISSKVLFVATLLQQVSQARRSRATSFKNGKKCCGAASETKLNSLCWCLYRFVGNSDFFSNSPNYCLQ